MPPAYKHPLLALSSYDETGIESALGWCIDRLEDGDTLSVWSPQRSNLRNSPRLENFVNQHADVNHITGRGHSFPGGRGPVLMAWPTIDDLGNIARFCPPSLALCVVSYDSEELEPWTYFSRPDLLGNAKNWNFRQCEIDPVAAEALKSLTLTVNQNNTISAGREKDQVVGMLLALDIEGIQLDPRSGQGWAIANGWKDENPRKLAEYIREINIGKRPKVRTRVPAQFIEKLRARARE